MFGLLKLSNPFSRYKKISCSTRSTIFLDIGRTQMGFDNHLCDMGLLLGLGFTSTQDSEANVVNPFLKKSTFDHVGGGLEPSLTLGLFGDTHQKIDMNKGCEEGDDLIGQASSQSAVSSFSSGRVKREREHSSEEIEVEKVSSRVVDEDEDGSNGRKKLRLTKDQSALLEESFKLNSTLNPKQKQALARQLNLRPRQVEVWFQNRRARTKLKQTEVECEFLKKCCQSLTDENRRLQKELQELKAVQMAQPLYMHMPAAAALAICPSCDRVKDGAPKTPFSMASNPVFYNLFTNPSAAC